MREVDFSYPDLLRHNAQHHGPALALAGDFEPLSHQALMARCTDLACALEGLGVSRGDRLAVLAPNRPQVMLLLGAAALLGATLVLLNVRGSADETAAVVADAAPRLLFADAALQASLALLPAELPCHALGPASGRLVAWPEARGANPHGFAPVDAAAPLVGIPTAAVEGRSRIALLSHTALLQQARLVGRAWALGPADRHLCLLPLYHAAGLGLSLAVQQVGGASVLMERFDALAAARAIEASRISCFTSFAPILGSVLDAAEAAGTSLASLRALTGLEAPETIARFEALCPEAVFWSGYGQTETAGLVCLAPRRERPGAAGRPLPGVALRIERPDGSAAGPGEAGEIALRGPFVFSGYWQRPAETAHAARGGWHHTGDLGRLDAQGWLWFEGRAPEKALIKSGGENVYPAEVERALLEHPAIAGAIVIGVPDAQWGEAVRAVCVRRPGHEVDGPALIEHVAGRIARFKRPREVVFVQALPRRDDGQWDRAAVAALHGR